MISFLIRTTLILLLSTSAAAQAAFDKQIFSSKAELSSLAAPIDGQLTLTLSLQYPDGYAPAVNLIREQLLSYNGFGEPPFTLKSEEISAPVSKDGLNRQVVSYILLPQTLGRHYLSPKTVTFLPDDPKENPVIIPIEIFEVAIADRASDLNPEAMAAPFLGFSSDLPVDISYSNKQHLLNKNVVEREAEKLSGSVRTKSFPWLSLLSAAVVALAVILIRTLPAKAKDMLGNEEEMKRQRDEIRKTLRELADIAPQSPESARTYFIQVEESLKQLLDKEYHLKTYTSTSQELANDIATLSKMSPHLKNKLIDLFATADKIKFARYRPDDKDYSTASEAARQAGHID